MWLVPIFCWWVGASLSHPTDKHAGDPFHARCEPAYCTISSQALNPPGAACPFDCAGKRRTTITRQLYGTWQPPAASVSSTPQPGPFLLIHVFFLLQPCRVSEPREFLGLSRCSNPSSITPVSPESAPPIKMKVSQDCWLLSLQRKGKRQVGSKAAWELRLGLLGCLFDVLSSYSVLRGATEMATKVSVEWKKK